MGRKQTEFYFINRPGVAGAVLQRASSFIHSWINSSFSSRSSKHHNSQTLRARGLIFWRLVIPPNPPNPISHWNASNFTLEEIQFHIWTNPISHWNKSNFTLEKIQYHIGKNQISHWNKSTLTLEQIQFHIGTNPISH